MLKEAKETQQVGRSGGVTARVAFLFGFGLLVLVLVFAVFCCFFYTCFFGGFVFSGEAASVAPRAAEGGERPAKRTAVQETKETKEVAGENGAATTRVAFFVPFLYNKGSDVVQRFSAIGIKFKNSY